MSIPEAIVYLLSTSNGGMRTQVIADRINQMGLHRRKDGKPVTSQQVYAIICRYHDLFIKEDGVIRVMM